MPTNKQNALAWQEKDFTEWFCGTPKLPTLGWVGVLAVSREANREVDILAVTSDGDLVLVEIKNERSTRAVIGQTVEYLSQYAGASLGDVQNRMVVLGNAANRTAHPFKMPARLSNIRHVYIAAPSFDLPTKTSVRFLGDNVFGNNIRYHLLRVERADAGFHLVDEKCPELRHANQLGGEFGMTATGRVFYVLETTPQPILWNLGKRKGSLPLAAASHTNLLRHSNRLLAKIEQPQECDLTLSGKCWQRTGGSKQAKVIGGVTDASGEKWTMVARFHNGEFTGFGKLESTHFHKRWQPSSVVLPSWGEILKPRPFWQT